MHVMASIECSAATAAIFMLMNINVNKLHWWQVTDVKTKADLVSQLRRVGKGHGVYHFDKDLMQRGSALSLASASA